MSRTNASARKNPFTSLIRYLQGAKEELEKVTWPPRTDVIRYSAVVVGVAVVMAAAFAALDWGLQEGLASLIRLSTR